MDFNKKLEQINKMETSVPDGRANGEELSKITKHEIDAGGWHDGKYGESFANASGNQCNSTQSIRDVLSEKEQLGGADYSLKATANTVNKPFNTEGAQNYVKDKNTEAEIDCGCRRTHNYETADDCHCNPCDCEAADDCHCNPCDCEAADDCHCNPCDCEAAEDCCQASKEAVRNEEAEMSTDSYYEMGSDEFIQYSDAAYVTPYHNTCEYSMITPDPRMLNNGDKSDNNHIAVTSSS